MAVRITQNMTFNAMRDNLGRAQARQFEAQAKASSGLRVQKPSDDPIAAARSVMLDTGLDTLHSMKRGSNEAMQQLGVTDVTLGSAADRMTRVRELTIQSLNPILTASDRSAIATEIQLLRDELLSLANTDVAGVKIFGGYQTDTDPFLADGTFVGIAGERNVEVAPGKMIATNISGDEAFAPVGGQSLFLVLDTLVANITVNDSAATQLRLAELDIVQEQLIGSHAKTGARLADLERADDNRENAILSMEQARTDNVGIDPTMSYTELVQATNSLEAAMSVSRTLLRNMSSTLIQ